MSENIANLNLVTIQDIKQFIAKYRTLPLGEINYNNSAYQQDNEKNANAVTNVYNQFKAPLEPPKGPYYSASPSAKVSVSGAIDSKAITSNLDSNFERLLKHLDHLKPSKVDVNIPPVNVNLPNFEKDKNEIIKAINDIATKINFNHSLTSINDNLLEMSKSVEKYNKDLKDVVENKLKNSNYSQQSVEDIMNGYTNIFKEFTKKMQDNAAEANSSLLNAMLEKITQSSTAVANAGNVTVMQQNIQAIINDFQTNIGTLNITIAENNTYIAQQIGTIANAVSVTLPQKFEELHLRALIPGNGPNPLEQFTGNNGGPPPAPGAGGILLASGPQNQNPNPVAGVGHYPNAGPPPPPNSDGIDYDKLAVMMSNDVLLKFKDALTKAFQNGDMKIDNAKLYFNNMVSIADSKFDVRNSTINAIGPNPPGNAIAEPDLQMEIQARLKKEYDDKLAEAARENASLALMSASLNSKNVKLENELKLTERQKRENELLAQSESQKRIEAEQQLIQERQELERRNQIFQAQQAAVLAPPKIEVDDLIKATIKIAPQIKHIDDPFVAEVRHLLTENQYAIPKLAKLLRENPETAVNGNLIAGILHLEDFSKVTRTNRYDESDLNFIVTRLARWPEAEKKNLRSLLTAFRADYEKVLAQQENLNKHEKSLKEEERIMRATVANKMAEVMNDSSLGFASFDLIRTIGTGLLNKGDSPFLWGASEEQKDAILDSILSESEKNPDYSFVPKGAKKFVKPEPVIPPVKKELMDTIGQLYNDKIQNNGKLPPPKEEPDVTPKPPKADLSVKTNKNEPAAVSTVTKAEPKAEPKIETKQPILSTPSADEVNDFKSMFGKQFKPKVEPKAEPEPVIHATIPGIKHQMGASHNPNASTLKVEPISIAPKTQPIVLTQTNFNKHAASLQNTALVGASSKTFDNDYGFGQARANLKVLTAIDGVMDMLNKSNAVTDPKLGPEIEYLNKMVKNRMGYIDTDMIPYLRNSNNFEIAIENWNLDIIKKVKAKNEAINQFLYAQLEAAREPNANLPAVAANIERMYSQNLELANFYGLPPSVAKRTLLDRNPRTPFDKMLGTVGYYEFRGVVDKLYASMVAEFDKPVREREEIKLNQMKAFRNHFINTITEEVNNSTDIIRTIVVPKDLAATDLAKHYNLLTFVNPVTQRAQTTFESQTAPAAVPQLSDSVAIQGKVSKAVQDLTIDNVWDFLGKVEKELQQSKFDNNLNNAFVSIQDVIDRFEGVSDVSRDAILQKCASISDYIYNKILIRRHQQQDNAYIDPEEYAPQDPTTMNKAVGNNPEGAGQQQKVAPVNADSLLKQVQADNAKNKPQNPYQLYVAPHKRKEPVPNTFQGLAAANKNTVIPDLTQGKAGYASQGAMRQPLPESETDDDLDKTLDMDTDEVAKRGKTNSSDIGTPRDSSTPINFNGSYENATDLDTSTASINVPVKSKKTDTGSVTTKTASVKGKDPNNPDKKTAKGITKPLSHVLGDTHEENKNHLYGFGIHHYNLTKQLPSNPHLSFVHDLIKTVHHHKNMPEETGGTMSAKPLTCSLCNTSDDRSEFHHTKDGEILHEKCFQAKGMTKKRKLFEHVYGEKITADSKNPKIKKLHDQHEQARINKNLETTKFENNHTDILRNLTDTDKKFLEYSKSKYMAFGSYNATMFRHLALLVCTIMNRETTNSTKFPQWLKINFTILKAKYLEAVKPDLRKDFYGGDHYSDNLEKAQELIKEHPSILTDIEFF